MKNTIIGFVAIAIGVFYWIFVSNHLSEDRERELKIHELENQLAHSSNKNDAALLKEYQDAFSIFLETNPKAAMKFSKIIEDINTK